MASGSKTWLGLAVPSGWADVLVRSLMTAVVAFVSLALKEWMETREWDLPACAVDAACVAGGAFALNAILTLGLARSA